MAAQLENKIAIITGAGSGIGAATAQRFAAEGASVVCCGRRQELLDDVVQSIQAVGGTAQAMQLDVADETAFTQLVNTVVEDYGRVDVLVNNAGLVGPGMLDSSTTEDWHLNFKVCLDGSFYGTRAVFPAMMKQRSGAIVNVSSICGSLATKGTAGYSAAKAGVIALSRNTAIEGAPYNIRANTISPGVVMTPAAAQTMPSQAAVDATAASVPMNRIGDAAEAANAILFLASDEASYITGVNIPVDGGRACELVVNAADISELGA